MPPAKAITWKLQLAIPLLDNLHIIWLFEEKRETRPKVGGVCFFSR